MLLPGLIAGNRRALPVCLAVVALAAAAGCGAADPGLDRATSAPTGAPTSPVGPTGAPVLHSGTGTVLESPEHGPELCLGGVQESFPPQCGGVPLRGWDWTQVEGEQSANGTTWGSYRVTGHYDGSSLTLTSAPTAPPPGGDRPVDGDPFSTPCPPPEGGWQVVGTGPVGQEGIQEAYEVARQAPDFAGLWIDQPPPGDEPEARPPPEQVVLNVAFTGDLQRHEAELRRVWGGPLCVSRLPRTYAELVAVQDELTAGGVAQQLGLEPLHAGTDESRGVVELGVVAFTPEQEAAVRERYADAVELTAGLEPVP